MLSFFSICIPLAHFPTFRRMIPIEITHVAKKNTTTLAFGRPSSRQLESFWYNFNTHTHTGKTAEPMTLAYK